jgi:hypothetical protein
MPIGSMRNPVLPFTTSFAATTGARLLVNKILISSVDSSQINPHKAPILSAPLAQRECSSRLPDHH